MLLQTFRIASSAAFAVVAFYFIILDNGQNALFGMGVFVLAFFLWVPWRGLFVTYIHLRHQNGKSTPGRIKALLMLLPAIRFYHHDILPPSFEKPAAESLSLLALNAYDTSRKISSKADFILEANADIVAVSEVNEHWELAMENMKHAYPYQRINTAHDSLKNYKMLLLSKYPVKVLKKRANGRVVHYQVSLPQGDIYLVQVHPKAPLTPRRTDTRNKTLHALAEIDTDLPLIIMGDFNCVPWQKPVREILRTQNLKLAGVPNPTYPAIQKVHKNRHINVTPVSPLDYILIPADATLFDAQSHRVPDTDHLAVSAVLSL